MPCKIDCVEIGTGTGLFTEHLDLPLSLLFHSCSIVAFMCMLLLRGRKTEKIVSLPRNKISVEIREHYLDWYKKYFHFFNTLRTGDADLRFYIITVQDGWRRFAFLTRWNSVHLQVLLSATQQGVTFLEVSHPQALLGSLVSISSKFQFTKIVSKFVINF